jgi:hypothetical protein
MSIFDERHKAKLISLAEGQLARVDGVEYVEDAVDSCVDLAIRRRHTTVPQCNAKRVQKCFQASFGQSPVV